MNNFVSIFENIHNKFIDNFNKTNKNKVKITDIDNHYLEIIFRFKKITLSKFAEIAKVTKPGATQIINKFINKGYVTKSVCEKDKRVCYIELTENIKKYLSETYKKLNNMYNECLSFLTKEEIEQFSHLLLKINDNL